MRLLYICAVTGILLGIGAVIVLGVRQSDETVRFCLERQRLTAVLVRAVRPPECRYAYRYIQAWGVAFSVIG